MKTFELNGTLKSETGKKYAKQIRRKAIIPAIIYGGKENVMISIIEADLRHLLYTPSVYLVNLNIEGKKYTCTLKEVQYHPVSDKPLHLDFIEVHNDKNVTIAIPVEITGVAEGVKIGGQLNVILRKLKVSALPKHLPDTLKIDVTKLEIGQSILVGDLNYPNVTILDPKSTVVVGVRMTRAARGAAQAAAEAVKK
jgi:large subunit ribosomal protein L25